MNYNFDDENPIVSDTPDEQPAVEKYEYTAPEPEIPEPVKPEPVQPEPPKREPEYAEAGFRAVESTERKPYTPGYTNYAQFYAPPAREREVHSPVPRERHERQRRGGFVRAVALVLVCALVSTAASWGAIRYGIESGSLKAGSTQVILGATAPPTSASGNSNSTDANNALVLSGTLSGQEIYKIAANQVVCVSTEIPSQGWSPAETVYGSGFVISEDGYILTNNHVIEYANLYGFPLTVLMRDGTSYKAKVIGSEADNDVAVIKIDATGLPPVKIGSSAAMEVGERIYAVGNPRQLDYTMTDGIISALDRSVTVSESDNITINMFQISAAVNSGNSGGPVYNTRGEVLGIVSAKYSSSGAEGLGFAIPIDDAMDIASELIANGYVTGKARLGISVYTVDARTAEYYNMVEGVFVKTVEPGSCSEKAGIVPGDIITKLGDTDITSSETLKVAKRAYKAGDTAAVRVFRDGKTITLNITFDEELVATD
ncbi:MAG: trypsin-like peptidase domain-containing protein [Oscillospiraceae bacterium]|jgi:serine protease Do|nr:trypsin-like peptidase domain-containing protein [Oscillospiraceae bacterium]